MQPVDPIPNDVKAFVFANIDSVELLEILILLHRDPQSLWTAQMISDTLRTHISSAKNRLAALESKSLLIRDTEGDVPEWHYSPASQELARLTDEVIRCYSERRVSIIELIFSRPKQNMQTFADAFRLRKDSQ